MTFSQAIEKAKSGSQITRASWRDQYVALTTGICKIYLCERTGEESGGKIVLQYLPHELIGNYFSEA